MSEQTATERPTYFIKAMQEGLAAAMREDDRVVVIGEDVSRSVIGATRGLAKEFGDERVRNTPISEQAFVGAGLCDRDVHDGDAHLRGCLHSADGP